DWYVVGMTRDFDLPLNSGERIGHAREQPVVLARDGVAAGLEKVVAVDRDDASIRGIAHFDQAARDFFGEETRQARLGDLYWPGPRLRRGNLDRRDLRSKLIRFAVQAEVEQQIDAEECDSAHRGDDPKRQSADPASLGLGYPTPVGR